MRIIHFSTHLSRTAGGLYYSVSGLAKAQMEAGAEVLVVGGQDQYFKEDRSEWGAVKLLSYSVPQGGYGLKLEPINALRRFKPDILHVHGIWSAASIYATISTRIGTPTVISPRGMLDPWILQRSKHVKQVHATLFERPALRKAYVHALSQSEYDSILKFMPSALARTFIIPNGIGEVGLTEETPRDGALYIGRLHAKKQVIELAKLWRQSAALKDIMLTIAGWGDLAYETELVSIANGSSNVRFVGALYGDAKKEAFNATRFFILPSLSEGLPMAALEALHHGAVPILTDECNLPELFNNQVGVRIQSDLTDLERIVSDLVNLPALLSMIMPSMRELCHRGTFGRLLRNGCAQSTRKS
ncbi:glycosyltransferase [Mycolicibacterium vaccae]|nr:glycosyltransferase [Mycolicibacterium vaccae]